MDLGILKFIFELKYAKMHVDLKIEVYINKCGRLKMLSAYVAFITKNVYAPISAIHTIQLSSRVAS